MHKSRPVSVSVPEKKENMWPTAQPSRTHDVEGKCCVCHRTRGEAALDCTIVENSSEWKGTLCPSCHSPICDGELLGDVESLRSRIMQHLEPADGNYNPHLGSLRKAVVDRISTLLL